MLSVIIPTRNRQEFLRAALASLTRQTLPARHFEILVVDNGSRDSTAAMVHALAATLPNLLYLQEPEPGLHAGRHRGMLAAAGEVLVFADDDIEAQPTWLAAIAEGFADPTVAMLGGNNLPLFLAPPPAWLLALWHRSRAEGGLALPTLSILQLPGPARAISPFYVWGCNFAIRKSILVQAGGFHPDGMPNELIRFRGDGETHIAQFVATSGMKSLFHPAATIQHKVTPERMTLDYFRQRGFNQGVSDSYTALREGANQPQPLWTLPSRLAHGVGRRLEAAWFNLRSPPEARRARVEEWAGYQEGYAFHQDAYRTDESVRAWVHKPTYFNSLSTV